ncbi:M20/M25/M40 family metallo-hydrolase [Streptomyces sp. NBC_00853]|nr:M20/M25/M40 family metallo-hydrolase [Streptomyces sp. NBC_01207]WTA17005.1 M20/M25/M40 family metallo-hydrolase [Streptomyces sp. NBC_00853]
MSVPDPGSLVSAAEILAAPDREAISEIAAGIDGELIEPRREIHRHPELAGDELRTSALVADRLRAAGLAVSTGVGATAWWPRSTVRVPVRLSPTEPTWTPSPTTNCSTPISRHTFPERPTCAATTCTPRSGWASPRSSRGCERWNGRIVFVFQPAEETLEGARATIEEGILERTSPQEVYALHCGPFPVGTFAVMPGFGLPGQDHFQVELTGPDAVADAKRLVALADGWSTVEYPQTPEQFGRFLEELQIPGRPAGTFRRCPTPAGFRDDRALVRVWLRAWPDSRYVEIRNATQSTVDSLTSARVEFAEEAFPATVCSPELSERAATYLHNALGDGAVLVFHAVPLQWRGLRTLPEGRAWSDVLPWRRKPGSRHQRGSPHPGLRRG